MEDLKRLIFPAIIALLLHGFLISFKLPKHERLKPVLQGNPMRIEITTLSPHPVTQKKDEVKKVDDSVKTSSPPKVVRKEIVRKEVVTPPPKIIPPKKNIQRKQNKVVIKPEPINRNVSVKKRDEQTYPQDSQQINQQKKSVETIPEEVNYKAVVLQKTAIPMYRKNKQPPYPLMARRRGYEGKILLNVFVNSKGVVSEIKIKQSSGHPSLDTSALETVQNWLFTPASEGGRPVAMWVDVPIEFKLK